MKRKLVKQGLRALTFTIPAEWVKKNGLNPGDEIDVMEADNTLCLSMEGKHQLKEISVDVSGLSPRLADRFLARAYQKGYDKIHIVFDDPELMLAIKNKVPELMGYEIINIGKKSLEIQAIAADLNFEFDTLLRRAFLILLDMIKTCHDAWKTQDRKTLEQIVYQDLDVNKFTYFCLRTLNTSKKNASFGNSILYYLIESLEDLGDEFKTIGKVLAPVKTDTTLLRMLGEIASSLKTSYEFFYEPKRERAEQGYKLSKEVSKEIYEMIGQTSDPAITRALLSMQKATDIISHLITMRLDTLKELEGKAIKSSPEI